VENLEVIDFRSRAGTGFTTTSGKKKRGMGARNLRGAVDGGLTKGERWGGKRGKNDYLLMSGYFAIGEGTRGGHRRKSLGGESVRKKDLKTGGGKQNDVSRISPKKTLPKKKEGVGREVVMNDVVS